MKEKLISIITAGIIGCSVPFVPVATVEPTPTVTPLAVVPTVTLTPTVEPLEKKLMGVKVMTNGNIYVLGFAYDTNGNNYPDTFEAYFGHYNPDTGWIHKLSQ